MKKKYDPNSFEQHHYERWEKNKYFKPSGPTGIHFVW